MPVIVEDKLLPDATAATRLMTRDEARRIAANIAKLPRLITGRPVGDVLI